MNTATPDAPASVVDLTGLPEPVIRSIRQLVESLRAAHSQPSPDVSDPLTAARAELHRELMGAFDTKWAEYGPHREDAK